MTERLAVADAGNTALKWALCDAAGVSGVSRLGDDPALWRLPHGYRWAIAGSHPGRADALARYLESRGDRVRRLRDLRDVPIFIDVDAPERVGIDRLLNAVAARARLTPESPEVVVVSVGTAVTIDRVTLAGGFHGGAILPGARLMARALHEHTAALPLVEVSPESPWPGRDTVAAIRAGIRGAIQGAVRLYASPAPVLWTGGDAALFAGDERVIPELTLDGIRLSLAGVEW